MCALAGGGERREECLLRVAGGSAGQTKIGRAGQKPVYTFQTYKDLVLRISFFFFLSEMRYCGNYFTLQNPHAVDTSDSVVSSLTSPSEMADELDGDVLFQVDNASCYEITDGTKRELDTGALKIVRVANAATPTGATGDGDDPDGDGVPDLVFLKW